MNFVRLASALSTNIFIKIGLSKELSHEIVFTDRSNVYSMCVTFGAYQMAATP